jgi:uncharacterized protein (TIGR00106 family)
MAMMEISVIPLGTGKTSLSPYVAEMIKYLRRRKGIQWELNAMGSIVTGEVSRLFKLAAALHKIPFSKGVKRVYTVIKLDDRKDKAQGPADKVASVLRKLE